MNILQNYKCKIKLRPDFKGHKLKEKVRQLDGEILVLQCMWQCKEHEMYAMEFALGGGSNNDAQEMLHKADIAWIASGDVEVIK